MIFIEVICLIAVFVDMNEINKERRAK